METGELGPSVSGSRDTPMHTPGPWRLDEYGEVVGGKYGSPICELPPASMLAGSISEHTANARLITAAPDLLAALEAIVSDEELIYTGGAYTSLERAEMDSTIELAAKALNAIKKARGQ